MQNVAFAIFGQREGESHGFFLAYSVGAVYRTELRTGPREWGPGLHFDVME